MNKLKLLLLILLSAACASAAVVFAACGDKGNDAIPFGPEQVGTNDSDKDTDTDNDTDNDNDNDNDNDKDNDNEEDNNKDDEEDARQTITGVTLPSAEYTYDGQTHSLEISGVVPDGVAVAYENNQKTDAGEYSVTATLTGGNYKPLTLTATLTINKADITGITFDGDTVVYDGQAHSLEISGVLPDGVFVAYENNGKTEEGSYEIKATLTGRNYNTLELTAVLRILPNLSGLAQSIMENFGTSTPDIWEYLPESFAMENRKYTGPQTIDFTSAKSVSAIPVSGIGKQLDVVYGTAIDMQNLLNYADKLYTAATVITGLYQDYINTHPDDYKTFEGQTDGGAIGFRIELEDSLYKLLAKVGPANIELAADPATHIYTGRVQIADSNALKFEVGENSLTIALNILGHAVSQLMFVRTGSGVSCHMYETLYFGDKALKETSALLTWVGDTVEVCGTNGDFFLGSKGEVVELYDADTGEYLGSKVKESISSVEFNTYWFNLKELGGINTVRVIEEKHSNGTLATESPYTVYINGSSDYFVPKLVGGLSVKTRSRRYDIEMKTTYYYVYNEAEDSYQKIEIEIPMLSVQAENYSTLAADIESANSGLTVTVKVLHSTTEVLDLYYEEGLAAYEEIADLITPQDIADYVGVKDGWFDN